MENRNGLRELTSKELEHVTGGAGQGWTTQNSAPGSGQAVPGGGQGLDTTTTNKGGNAPPGQQ
jgi:bacteriocin-like protein